VLAEVLFVERFAHVGWVAEGRFWDGVVLEADESGVDCFERLVVYSASFSSSLLQGRVSTDTWAARSWGCVEKAVRCLIVGPMSWMIWMLEAPVSMTATRLLLRLTP